MFQTFLFLFTYASPSLAPSAVTDLTAITENSESVLIQWGLPEQPNGTITYYIVSFANIQHFVQGNAFFYSLDRLDPGETLTFNIHAQIDDVVPVVEGVMTGLRVTLNTTVPFLDAELTDSGISTLTLALPPASLYPQNGNIK